MIFIRFYEFALFAFIAFFSYQASQLNQGLWLTGLCINCPCPFNSLTSDQYFSIAKSLHPHFYQLIWRYFLFETVYLFQSSFFTFWFRKQVRHYHALIICILREKSMHAFTGFLSGKKMMILGTFGSSCSQVFLTIFTGKHRGRILFFNKVTSLRPKTLLRKRLQHRCFSVNFPKFLRTLF